MGLFETLDKILCGEAALNRWKNERQNSGFKNAKDIEKEKYFKEKEQKEILRREMEKYSRGHLFKIDQVPEIIKNAMMISYKNLSDWNKDTLKKSGTSGKYYLHRKVTDIQTPIAFLVDLLGGRKYHWDTHIYDSGLEYVENEQGESALRLFREKDFYLQV